MTSNPPPDTRVPQFSNTTDRFARFYSNYLQAIPDEIQRLGCKRVFLLVSTSLDKKTDRIKRLEQVLGDSVVGKKVGVTAHTPFTDILDLTRQLHQSRADSIVSVGSSSYTDAAKVALLAHSSLEPSDLSISALDSLKAQNDANGRSTIPPVKAPQLKLILTPTTLSAAEYHVASGASNPVTRKKDVFTHPLCAAQCIILDPELCTTTPQRLWLGTGIRAVDHCVEALCTDLSTREVEESAEIGLRHLVPGLLASQANQADIKARGDCQVGAWRAMEVAHHKVPLGASHAIGHQLGSVAGVPHGETSCVMLHAVMKYNKGVNSARQEKVTKILWDVAGRTFEGVGLDRGHADAGDLIKAFVLTLGLPTTLGDVGVRDQSQLDRIAELTLTDIWGKTNPRKLDSKEQVLDILRMAS